MANSAPSFVRTSVVAVPAVAPLAAVNTAVVAAIHTRHGHMRLSSPLGPLVVRDAQRMLRSSMPPQPFSWNGRSQPPV
ncbi:MAG: hypothetical protein HYX76_01045 [Acidobacteria bacterium]|nr:hypothetical protein [Acidobacteriota bacterium]